MNSPSNGPTARIVQALSGGATLTADQLRERTGLSRICMHKKVNRLGARIERPAYGVYRLIGDLTGG